MKEIYVILIDGSPYLALHSAAIRTYKTRERAEKEVRELIKRYGRPHEYTVGIFAVSEPKIVEEAAN